MEPTRYDGNEWRLLAKELTPRQLRKSLKSAYRKEARKALAIARTSLMASGLKVEGDRSDWKKGVRAHYYSRGGGFLVTVKGKASGRGGKEQSMHRNRRGRKLPILMWAEDGTQARYSARRGKKHRRNSPKNGTYRGSMEAYGFLAKAAPAMYRSVQDGMLPQVEAAVRKVAAKCGFV